MNGVFVGWGGSSSKATVPVMQAAGDLYAVGRRQDKFDEGHADLTNVITAVGEDAIVEVMRDSSVDYVVVGTTDESHGFYVRNALQAGLHVLVDKPVVRSHQGTERLVELAQERDLALVECTQLECERPDIERLVERYGADSVEVNYLIPDRKPHRAVVHNLLSHVGSITGFVGDVNAVTIDYPREDGFPVVHLSYPMKGATVYAHIGNFDGESDAKPEPGRIMYFKRGEETVLTRTFRGGPIDGVYHEIRNNTPADGSTEKPSEYANPRAQVFDKFRAQVLGDAPKEYESILAMNDFKHSAIGLDNRLREKI